MFSQEVQRPNFASCFKGILYMDHAKGQQQQQQQRQQQQQQQQHTPNIH